MKKPLLVLLALLTMSCGGSRDLLGQWTWEETSGGITGTVEKADSAAKIPYLVITKDSIKEYENGILMEARAYDVKKRKSVRTGKRERMIIYEDGTTSHTFELKGQELIIYEDCNDCFQYRYMKSEE